MPRKYVRKPNVTPRAQWTQENLTKAMKALDEGKLSLNEIARRYQIPSRTLRRRYANRNDKKRSLGRHPALDFDNEDHLVATILKLGKENPLSRNMIRRIAFEFAEQLGLNVPFNKETRMAGIAWLASFLERHPQVKISNKDSSEERKDDCDKQFSDAIAKHLEEVAKEYRSSKDSQPEPKGSQTDSDEDDPLMIKFEPMDESNHAKIEINVETPEINKELSRCNNINKIPDVNQECTSTGDVSVKRRRNTLDDEYSNTSREDLVDVKCDRVDLLFLGYAAALKKMSRRKQIIVKHEIAKIFMEAELSELE